MYGGAEKVFIVTGHKVGRRRYLIESEEFDIKGVYKGTLDSIQARIQAECKRKLVYDVSATYLVRPPKERNMPPVIGDKDIAFFIHIPMFDLDVGRLYANKLMDDRRRELNVAGFTE